MTLYFCPPPNINIVAEPLLKIQLKLFCGIEVVGGEVTQRPNEHAIQTRLPHRAAQASLQTLHG